MAAFDELPAKTQRKWWIAFGVVVFVVAGIVAWMLWPEGSDSSGDGDRETEQAEDSPDPADARPEIPDEARKQSQAGIEATVQYRYELLNYAQRTRDFDATSVVEDESCKFCSSFRQSLPELFPDGQRVRSGGYKVTAFRDTTLSQPHDSSPIGSVEVNISIEAGELEDAKGNVIESLPAATGVARFALRYEPGIGRWLITNMEVAQS